MKKLFLYISLIILGILIFTISYFISKEYFRNNSLKVSIEEPIELTTRAENTTTDTQDIAFVDDVVFSPDKINNTKTYSLGEKNGYVVVYDDSTGKIFEYTDISLDILKALNIEVYRVLYELKFDSKYELFEFLESLDS